MTGHALPGGFVGHGDAPPPLPTGTVWRRSTVTPGEWVAHIPSAHGGGMVYVSPQVRTNRRGTTRRVWDARVAGQDMHRACGFPTRDMAARVAVDGAAAARSRGEVARY